MCGLVESEELDVMGDGSLVEGVSADGVGCGVAEGGGGGGEVVQRGPGPRISTSLCGGIFGI